MKLKELKNIIRETIEEQKMRSGGIGNTVSAKGCCKELHILQRLIALKQQEVQQLENSQSLFDSWLGNLLGSNQELITAQMQLEQYESAYQQMQATGCCKGM